jgi:hypothetical protein
MADRKYQAICPGCSKHSRSKGLHEVDARTYQLFGRDAYCMKCVDQDHLRFMATTGKRLGLSCVKGCPCGRGK